MHVVRPDAETIVFSANNTSTDRVRSAELVAAVLADEVRPAASALVPLEMVRIDDRAARRLTKGKGHKVNLQLRCSRATAHGRRCHCSRRSLYPSTGHVDL